MTAPIASFLIVLYGCGTVGFIVWMLSRSAGPMPRYCPLCDGSGLWRGDDNNFAPCPVCDGTGNFNP